MPEQSRRLSLADAAVLVPAGLAVLVVGLLAGTWITYARYPDIPDDGTTSTVLLRAQLEQAERHQEAMLQTVYFMLGTTIVVLFALIAYGWFQNRFILERQVDESRQAIQRMEAEVAAAERRARKALRRARRQLRAEARQDLEREIESIDTQMDLLGKLQAGSYFVSTLDVWQAAIQQRDLPTIILRGTDLLNSVRLTPELDSEMRIVANVVRNVLQAAEEISPQDLKRIIEPLMHLVIAELEHLPQPHQAEAKRTATVLRQKYYLSEPG